MDNLSNAHVVVYYRFKAWVAWKMDRVMSYEFFAQWADWEENGWPRQFRKPLNKE